MPRPRRSQGRPGTPVIPATWGAEHAPVLDRTRNGAIRIHAPVQQDSTPVLNPDYTITRPVDQTPDLFTGAARIQMLNGQELAQLVGDQEQITVGYLVTISYDALSIPMHALIEVTACTDPRLVDRRLIVRRVGSGTERFESYLWCVDDMTREV